MASNRVIDADNDIIIKGLQWPSSDGTANQVIQTDGSGTLTFTDQTGGGGTGINHITNPNAEVDTTGYVSYADAAATTPVDGTGGSANVTITRNTSSPLRNTADFQISKDASNRQGQGISYDFTVDNTDKAKKMIISFDYDASHAGYADGDIKIYIYDVTNTQLIRVANEDLKAGKGKHFSQFQSNSDSTSYRLIWHVASTNASAYNVFMDEVFVGPIHISNPVSSNDIVCVVEGLTSSITLSEGVGTVITGWNDPTVDTTNSFDGTNDYYVVPETGYYDINYGVQIHDEASPFDMDSVYQEIRVDGSAVRTGGFQTASGNASSISTVSIAGYYLTKGQQVDFTASYTGGDAQNQIANGAQTTYFDIAKRPSLMTPETIGNGQDIVLTINGLTGVQSINAATDTRITNWNAPLVDTVGGWDSSINKYIVPETGYYDVNLAIQIANDANSDITNVMALIRVDADIIRVGAVQHSASGLDNQFAKATAISYYMTKGQEIELLARHENVDAEANNIINTNGERTFVDIAKRSSGRTILENETVAMRYTSNAGTAIANNTNTTLIFGDKDSDTHNAYNTSTGVYTFPVSGYYAVDCKVGIYGRDSANNTRVFIASSIDSSGANDITLDTEAAAGSGAYDFFTLDGSYMKYFNKGQTINVFIHQNTGSSQNLGASAPNMYLSIVRIK